MFNKDYFPTPNNLIEKMLSKVDMSIVSSVLEPSAGSGNIVDVVNKKMKVRYYGFYDTTKRSFDIDCVEIEKDLIHILKGKGHRVVYDNFLTFNTYKNYDLIIANFPFSDGDKHSLKALELLCNNKKGGQLVFLINAETIKNPYSVYRKDLINKLEELNADIEFIQNAFIDADRKTDVEVALVYIKTTGVLEDSTLYTKLKQEQELNNSKETDNNYDGLISNDFIKGIVQQFDFECKLGINLIREYNNLSPYILKSFTEKNATPILNLTVNSQGQTSSQENEYIKAVRKKYWKTLFTAGSFMDNFTDNLRTKYLNKIEELQDYDFSLYNIYTIKIELNNEMYKSLEDTIFELFKTFTYKHHYNEEYGKNVHMYNGWKTNKAEKINDKKVIIPMSAFSTWDKSLEINHYTYRNKLMDIEKSFNYLCTDEDIQDFNLSQILDKAQKEGKTSKIETKFFIITAYKKGTTHIEFKYPELVHKLNIFGCQRLGYLPPTYGKKKYSEMTNEEQEVVDSFEGKESYNKVINNKERFILETSKILSLSA